MNKRIRKMLMSFILVICMLVTSIPVYAAQPTQIKVTANKTTAQQGDVIDYTITMGSVSGLGTIQMDLLIPNGVTYVANSGALASGLKATLGFDDVAFTEVTKRISGMALATDYSSNSDTEIATFQCRVDDEFTGNVEVSVNNLEFYSVETWEDNTSNFTVVAATVTIEAKPVAVESVSIDETASVNIGSTVTPSWTVNPNGATNKKVTFTSNNESVATVNETTGEVEGISKGTATITVKTEDGNFTDTCVVTVNCAHANKTNHAAGTSTCKVQANDQYYTCDTCAQIFAADQTTELNEIPMLPLSANHSYTKQDPKAAALVSEANCKSAAVYYYSCNVCDKVEEDANHTFMNGEKNTNNHVGGTQLINASQENHKTQQNGYTGDTQCLGCQAITEYGQPIPAGEHQPGDFITDGTYHWKECTINGCGVVIDNTKEEHGWGSDYEYNATQHWHECSVCQAKKDLDNHDPSLPNGATEEEANICNVCLYEIQPKLNHTHKFDQKVAADKYKASGATCEDPATYYKSCKCGEAGTETFASGTAKGHTEGTTWKRDDDNHWHVCTECGVVIDSSVEAHNFEEVVDAQYKVSSATCQEYAVYKKSCKCGEAGTETFKDINGDYAAHKWDTKWTKDENYHWHSCKTDGCTARDEEDAHTPDHEGGATEDYAVECEICHYEIEAKLPHEHVPGTEWKNNSSYHWHVCEKETCGAVIADSKEAHVDADHNRECDVCGYKLPEPEEEKPEGWIREAAKWYYYDNGKKVKGWKKVGKNWYFMKKTFPDYKAMQTGWIFDEGRWYYLAENGVMKTGWREIGGKWYYLGQSGAMKTGWFFDPDYNAWYYLHDENGDMLVNTTTPDGYYVGADGKWVQ